MAQLGEILRALLLRYPRTADIRRAYESAQCARSDYRSPCLQEGGIGTYAELVVNGSRSLYCAVSRGVEGRYRRPAGWRGVASRCSSCLRTQRLLFQDASRA